ncbi:MAG: DUF488 domain-containing protein [Candidatus Melainabacteria bacterium]|nr:DUF488 domain-containing protein [Candidatus Melainabacteria bacterium]
MVLTLLFSGHVDHGSRVKAEASFVESDCSKIKDASSREIYTIGHSNHPLKRFMELLERYEIEVLVDIRSSPFSRFSRHFSQEPLKNAIQGAGLKYLFFGKELGGKPKSPEFYDNDGHVDYARIAASKPFAEGIERLISGCEKFRCAIMCWEESPLDCHRRRLVGPVLVQQSVEIKHIRGNGELQLEGDLCQGENNLADEFQQLKLFSQTSPEKPWRSSRPVKGKH